MTPIERAVEWAELVDWVVWIHDQYELSREERLPLCWTHHPGLVEELRSLKAWRDALYDTPGTRSATHTARSWHGELRQTITAATTFWARGCRAGHRDAKLLHNPERVQTWRDTPPPLMDSATPLRKVISHEEMNLLLRDGTAQRHSPVLGKVVTYAGAWWRRATDHEPWQRLVDPAQKSGLDDAANRINKANAAVDTLTRP